MTTITTHSSMVGADVSNADRHPAVQDQPDLHNPDFCNRCVRYLENKKETVDEPRLCDKPISSRNGKKAINCKDCKGNACHLVRTYFYRTANIIEWTRRHLAQNPNPELEQRLRNYSTRWRVTNETVSAQRPQEAFNSHYSLNLQRARVCYTLPTLSVQTIINVTIDEPPFNG